MKALKFIFGLALALSLYSCGNVTEEIHLKEDGSGTYHLEYDMVPMMKQMSFQMVKAFSGLDTTEPAKSDEEIMATVEEMIWSKFPEKIDSVIDYKSELPDSILNDEKKMAIINRATGFLKGGREEGVMMSGVDFRFDNVDQLVEFFELMESNSPEAKKTMGLNLGSRTSLYSFKKRTFTRTTKKSKEKEPEEDKDPAAKEREDKMVREMFGDGTYRTVVHLPKDVTKVTGDNIVSYEGNTVIFEYNLIDLINNEVGSDFKIVMEK